MAPIYEEVCQELGTSSDGALLAGMREANTKQLAELEEKIKDAGVCRHNSSPAPAARTPCVQRTPHAHVSSPSSGWQRQNNGACQQHQRLQEHRAHAPAGCRLMRAG